MALPSGSRLGPYEILAPLGAGGMEDREGDKMMSVAIGNSAAFAAGAPSVLFEGKYAVGLPGLPAYCVTSDGDGFLVVKPVDSGVPHARLEGVLNWVEELEAAPLRGDSTRMPGLRFWVPRSPGLAVAPGPPRGV